MKLPLLSGRQVLAALQRLGFVKTHGKGSHVKMKHPDGGTIEVGPAYVEYHEQQGWEKVTTPAKKSTAKSDPKPPAAADDDDK